MSDRNEQLQQYINNGEIDKAVTLINDAEDYHEGEQFVSTVLGNEKSGPELTEVVLEMFLATRSNIKPYHGYWVHSLSHFTNILWERRMDSWIKKFNEVAFRGANELNDPNCSDRLVWDFAHFARWNNDPVDFHLSADEIQWMSWEYSAYQKARIEASPFESEEAFLRWKLQQPKAYTRSSSWGGLYDVYLVDTEKMQAIIRRLEELRADTSGLTGFARDLLTKEMDELEGRRPRATEDWQKEILEEEIRKTRAALEALS